MYRGAMLNIHKYRLRASSCPDIYRNSMTTIAKEHEEVTSNTMCGSLLLLLHHHRLVSPGRAWLTGECEGGPVLATSPTVRVSVRDVYWSKIRQR
jgi:hypothetical protein